MDGAEGTCPQPGDNAGCAGAATPDVPVEQYRVHWRARHPIALPEHPSFAWRGLLGDSLKRCVCVTGLKYWPDSLLYRGCVFSYLFDTPPPRDSAKLRRYRTAPHPYALVCEGETSRLVAPGEPGQVGLRLFGRPNAQLPYIIHAFQRPGRTGVGARQGRFELRNVEQERTPGGGDRVTVYRAGETLSPLEPNWPIPPPVRQAIRVHLDKPLRLKRGGWLVNRDELGFRDLFSNLLRRISILSYFRGASALETDFRRLVERSWTRAARGAQARVEGAHTIFRPPEHTPANGRVDRLLRSILRQSRVFLAPPVAGPVARCGQGDDHDALESVSTGAATLSVPTAHRRTGRQACGRPWEGVAATDCDVSDPRQGLSSEFRTGTLPNADSRLGALGFAP